VPVYADRSTDDANQGDIFTDVSFAAYPRPDGDPSLGMVISHDCDCDKFLKPKTPIPEEQRSIWPITIAPVHPIEELTGGRIKAARERAMPRYFHVPAEDGLPELVADLWLEQPVPIERVLVSDRQASLSDEWRGRLWTQIIRLRTGRDIQAIARALQGSCEVRLRFASRRRASLGRQALRPRRRPHTSGCTLRSMDAADCRLHATAT
jgi:hypothetical protein